MVNKRCSLNYLFKGLCMYQEHPAFQPPAEDAILWRYMDFTKFASLLDKKALYFARADKLGDPFEGSFSKLNKQMRPRLLESQGVEADKVQLAVERVTEGLRQTPFRGLVNCWHENPYESEAMWNIYSREKDGIAIRTSFKGLSQSFVCDESVYIGKVAYVDYDTTFIGERNGFTALLHKRKSFEHEREVRAMTGNYAMHGERIGNYYRVDIDTLIEEVVVAPQAPQWFSDLVKSVARKYALNTTVAKSTLAAAPIW